ncbi:MAG: hypothetical protein VX278_01315 [Myxococcota bacterium]|nr:hypothetical protein [Myxococcota bacterium]
MYSTFLIASISFAQEEPPESEDRTRQFQFETNVRYRSMFLPDEIMDMYFHDEDDPGANPLKRPSISASVFGIELVYTKANSSWILYSEYMYCTMDEGYWEDIETGVTPDHDDGDWVRPDNFSGWFIGANFGYNFALTPKENDIWLSLVTGGGLGAGFTTGTLTFWSPGASDDTCYPGAPAYIRKDHCDPDGAKVEVPPVIPMVDLTFSLKLNFADRANIRLDGGLHDLIPYYGFAAGGVY